MNDIKPRAIRLRRDANALIGVRLGGPVSQRDLAERWGVSQASVSRWLTGNLRMPLDKALDLAHSTGIPLEELREQPAAAATPSADGGLRSEVLQRLAEALGLGGVKSQTGAMAAFAL